ncbi:bifunctional diaminohydroxyphosphoribosylaminopyrimidine deaminase/5-amino-6-(5-phosphoribosylamino)uracil reductase RibD [Spirosoma radiotolerans]|uniref:Riboflavin biosynthesis protein RibD n=1 Tax=Spirosoma radiotolerans TaxID=1379870 RepID=A0A0E3V7S7_9BACT|nr:bifunctional diaminohydroxyphosphoribosylaminopyrimidine deaminase/5-amino-6-(5-phosphoribosylamino)uracil reductase RibD [Spirosoma radiotolerans]AKD56127.1 riboflavin biosynthesis protein RibD [Spirosoma radiotolerans]
MSTGIDERFMLRALELATLGRGQVSPNPMVGCVITHESGATEPRIIGEGWHQRYGDWHAEVNAVRSVRPEDRHLLPEATVYVTLEPCSHWGKTPPCADLLIENRVKRVICCNDDPNPLVSGQGFAKLRAAGISVETGLLAEQGRQVNARFFTFFERKRPYIVLKWAETSDGFIAGEQGRQVSISGELAHRLVHRWRSEEPAIMVGANTARLDNPRLNVRLWPGLDGPSLDGPSKSSQNPTRIVLDSQLSLDHSLHLFDGSQLTMVYHRVEDKNESGLPNVTYSFVPENAGSSLSHVLDDLYQRKIQSVLVEGGTRLLTSFIEAGLWDEMRVFRSQAMLGTGIAAPQVRGKLSSRETIGKDELTIYVNA